MKLFLASLALCGLFVLGCGGNGSSDDDGGLEAGYYRGTFNVTSDGWINGSGMTFIDVIDVNNFAGEALGEDFYATITKTPQISTLIDGAVVTGDITVTETATGFDFTFDNGSGVTATGALEPAPLPTLGGSASVPGEGEFEGEFLVVASGHAKTFGMATSSVDADGDVTVTLTGGKGYLDDGLFTGKLEANGTISGAVLIVNGNILTQTSTPAYSYAGTTLVIRFDNLVLEGASCFVTLSPAPIP